MLTGANTFKLSVAGGGVGESEEFKSFTTCRPELSAHKGHLFWGQCIVIQQAAAAMPSWLHNWEPIQERCVQWSEMDSDIEKEVKRA